jgi:glyoxylase-like metal-dependent hydrolase (beta-lactamase superfamily II)
MILAVIGISFLTFAQEFEKVQIETVKVTEGVYMLVGSGGNIGVSAGENGILLIDDQFAQLFEKIKRAISNFNGGPIRIVLNTNWHYDHVSGNEPLGKSGAIIIGHENSRKGMTSEQSYPEFDVKIPPYPEAALPAVTFTDALTLYFNGDEIRAIHIEKAHSDADILVYFRKANVIHTGDLYFSGGYPFIDVPHGGSIDGMIRAADRILNMIDASTKVIPGHGHLSNRGELQEYRDMLVTVRDRIGRQIKEGKTLEEVLSSKPTADFDKGREQLIPPEMFVKIVYNDLSKR